MSSPQITLPPSDWRWDAQQGRYVEQAHWQQAGAIVAKIKKVLVSIDDVSADDHLGALLRESIEQCEEVAMDIEVGQQGSDPYEIIKGVGELRDVLSEIDEGDHQEVQRFIRYAMRLCLRVYKIYSFAGTECWLTAQQINARVAWMRGETRPPKYDENGALLNSVVNGVYYEQGKMFNGKKDGVMYYRGKPYNGTGMDEDGKKRYYREGKPYTGGCRVSTGFQVYRNGILA